MNEIAKIQRRQLQRIFNPCWSKNCLLELASETRYQKALKQNQTNNRWSGEKAYTATKIARILELLNDGQWHTPGDLQRRTKLNENQVQQVIAFLKEYQFVTVSETKEEIRLHEVVRRFLTQNVTS